MNKISILKDTFYQKKNPQKWPFLKTSETNVGQVKGQDWTVHKQFSRGSRKASSKKLKTRMLGSIVSSLASPTGGRHRRVTSRVAPCSSKARLKSLRFADFLALKKTSQRVVFISTRPVSVLDGSPEMVCLLQPTWLVFGHIRLTPNLFYFSTTA